MSPTPATRRPTPDRAGPSGGDPGRRRSPAAGGAAGGEDPPATPVVRLVDLRRHDPRTACPHGIEVDGRLVVACAERAHARALVAAYRADPTLQALLRPQDRPIPDQPLELQTYLRDLIAAHGLTQAQAAERMGVAARTVRAWLAPLDSPSHRDAVLESVELLRRRLEDPVAARVRRAPRTRDGIAQAMAGEEGLP